MTSSTVLPVYEHIICSTPKPGVGLSRLPIPLLFVRRIGDQTYGHVPDVPHRSKDFRSPPIAVVLNRPQALNALCNALVTELNDALSHFDKSKSIGAIILTGSEKAFAGMLEVKRPPLPPPNGHQSCRVPRADLVPLRVQL